ncbi:MAG: hypothetical protein E7133_07060 [Rikenellaceae bacterium]|nr:hypothetical protein [Rikenellaceae bacterium]MBR2014063.1 hypothetical protein [Alistipes sp.]
MKKLLNPFRYLAMRQIGCWGVAMMIMTAIYCWLLPLKMTSLTQVAIVLEQPRLWQSTVEQLAVWLIFTIVLFIIGKLFSTSQVRLQDVAAYNLFARLPFDVMLLMYTVPEVKSVMFKMQLLGEAIVSGANPDLSAVTQYMSTILLVSLVSLLFSVWYFYWSYKGFAEATNIRNGKGVALFIVGFLIAYVASGYLL